MEKSSFKHTLKSNEAELKRIRRIYFHFIKEGLITGYNLYEKESQPPNTGNVLSYLHADLKPTDKHFQELSAVIKNEFPTGYKILTQNRIVDKSDIVERNADYLTTQSWTDPQNMRYFALDGEELTRDEAKKLEIVVRESFQYDLLINVQEENDLRRLVNTFKKYTSRFSLDQRGLRKKLENKYAVVNAWDIPMLFFSTPGNKKPENFSDFLTVTLFNMPETIGNQPITLSTLVRRRAKELNKLLKQMNLPFSLEKRYVLRLAVSSYIDA